MKSRGTSRAATCMLLMVVLLGLRPAWANPANPVNPVNDDAASIRGTVVDPVGARVPMAGVRLLRDGQRVAETSSDARGEFAFEKVAEGRYQVEAMAAGFEPHISDPMFVSSSSHVVTVVALRIGRLEQHVSVTAAAPEIPLSQTGAPVTVVDRGTLDLLGKLDVQNALELVPGTQVVQSGQRGGLTSFFVRGGNSNFNKVLIDGVVANDIGGNFDFATLTLAGVDRVEVLRQSNSVLYGSDALNGVVSVATRRGRTRTPEVSYSIGGGNLGTLSSSLSVGGTAGRFDYFSEYAHVDTDNDTPNSHYRNGTYAGRFGLAVGRTTDLSGTLRRISARAGSPNAIDYFGIADDSSIETTSTYASVVAQSQITDRWRSTIRFGSSDQTSDFLNPTPTGQAFDPFGFGANYLGNTVTIRGANGFATSGRAILDYGGTYPSQFRSRTTRRSLSGQTTYGVMTDLDVSAGARFEHEAAFDDPNADPTATRNNGGLFLEARGTIAHRHHISAGLGYEHNAAFKSAVTPRVSVASYIRVPASAAAVGDTKLLLNAGTGIKAPSVFQEQSSLVALLKGVPGAPTVAPIGPERSRNFDAGVEQGLWGGHARFRVSYFNNHFSDLIEYVSKNVLPQLGVPTAVAAATQYGANVNSQSFLAEGVETSVEAAVVRDVHVSASYTYLDARVTKSFSSASLAPAINAAFPGIPIGQYVALVGQRPFRRPANSGAVMVSYAHGPVRVAVSGSFVGTRDDSTYLTDGFFGNSLLLPNRDLDAAYQRVDVSASYRFTSRLGGYATVENVANQDYAAASGYPSLPRTVRIGATITLGGDRRP